MSAAAPEAGGDVAAAPAAGGVASEAAQLVLPRNFLAALTEVFRPGDTKHMETMCLWIQKQAKAGSRCVDAVLVPPQSAGNTFVEQSGVGDVLVTEYMEKHPGAKVWAW